MKHCADAISVQRQWIEQALDDGRGVREDRWSEAIAVGSLEFVANVKNELGFKALHREVDHIEEAYTLRESSQAYDGDLPSETGL